jgi:hypothetical protein
VAKCFRNIFDKSAVSAIHKTCKGIPRLMNLLAERALMNAYNSNNAVVNRKIVLQAAHDALGDEFQVKPWLQARWVKVGSLVVSLCLVLSLGIWWGTYQTQQIGLGTNVTIAAINQLATVDEQKQLADREEPALVAAELGKVDSAINNNTNKLVSVVDKSTNPTKASNSSFEDAVTETTIVETSDDSSVIVDDESQFIARERKLADSQITAPIKAQRPVQKTEVMSKQRTNDNFVVKAEAGVSDELLASFQSAIEETKQSENSKENLATDTSELMPLTQMPTWVQDGVPALAFEMHIYASDGQGWVRVNGRDRYEGDYIGRELLLNEIRPQKVVLSFRGEKFTMAALSSWN